MSQYKLKQWYPTLPNDWKEEDVIVTNKYCDNPPKGEYAMQSEFNKGHWYVLTSEEVENNPEFWEEVQDPEYTDNDIDRAFKNSLVQGDYDRHSTLCIHVPTFKRELKKK